MKALFYLIISVLSQPLVGDIINNPPKEEINKIGSYQIKTDLIPERYRNLWTNSRFNKVREDEVKNDNHRVYSTVIESFKWNIWTPQKYDPQRPAGILVLPLSFQIEDFPQKWQHFCDSHNLILISPEFSKFIRTCNAALILCSIDIVKSRYKIDPRRIYLCAIKYHYYTDMLCFPEAFSGFVFVESGLHFSRKYFNKTLGGRRLRELDELLKKNYFAFIVNNENQKLPTEDQNIEVESFDSGTEYYRTENGWNSIWKKQYFQKNSKYKHITIDGQHETLLTQVDYFYGIDYTTMRDAVTFLDTPVINRGKELVKLGKQAENLKQYKKAIELYLLAENHHVSGAQNYTNRVLSLLKSQENKLRKLIISKDYGSAYKLATEVVKQYGTEHAKFSKLAVKEFLDDEKIALEIKAAVFLAKAEAALKQSPVPADKIKAACEKVIQTVPGTVTAEKAKAILEKIK